MIPKGNMMREIVEIGMGRTAHRTYDLDDINIVASRRTRSSQDVSTSWQLDAYRFSIPILSHPTDALSLPEFVLELGRLGGLGIINGEGLLGRHRDAQEKITQLIQAAAMDPSSRTAIQLLQQFHSTPVDHELLTEIVVDLRSSGITTAVRVSPQNAQHLAPVLVAAGIDLLIIQGTIISAEYVTQGHTSLNLKTFISELDIPVVVGGVLDYRTALHLMRAGAAGVIVGYGSARKVTTTSEVLGIHVPMATAITDVAAARKEYLDETGGRYVHVLADGDIYTSGDLAKAIACGADAVILGTPLASAQEAGGQGWYWTAEAAHPSLPRGAFTRISSSNMPRPHLSQILMGPSDCPTGSLNLVEGLRRSMAKAGYRDLKEFQKVSLQVHC